MTIFLNFEVCIISGYLALIIAMLSIQFGAAMAKGLFVQLGPAGTTALRVLFSACILLLLTQPWRQLDRYKKLLAQKKLILLIGIYGVSLGLMNLFFYLSLERIPLGLAVTLEFIGPLSVSILFSRKFKDVLWVFFAACGIGLLFYQGEIKTDLLGMIFALIAGVFWGLYIVFGKKISHNEHQSLILSAFGMLFAAVIVLPVGLFMNASEIVNPQNWLAGLGVAVLSSAIPYALELRAMKFIPEKTFGILMSFEPVIATVVGLVFLKESLALNQVIAICLVIAACFGSAYELRPTKS